MALADALGNMPGLTPEQQKYIKNQQMLGLAAAMLQSSAPSTDPRSGSMAYAMGSGLQGMQSAGQTGLSNILAQEKLNMKKSPNLGGNNLSDTQLYSILTHSPNLDDRKKASAMLKYRRAQAPEVSGVTLAKRRAETQTAQALETQKGLGEVAGKGLITPIQKKQEAQQKVSDVLDTLRGHYKKLDNQGAIVNVEKGVTSNVIARIKASGAGQLTGKAVGTEEQSIRNKINQIRPLLINHIRQASEMGARGLDSEKELEFYLQAATDPSLDIQMNLAALKVLENAYGMKKEKTIETPKQKKRLTFNPIKGIFE